MTVVSDRAGGGARSLLRVLSLCVFAVLGIASCGNNRYYYGTAVITVSSDPGPFSAYIADLTLLELIRNDGAVGYTFTGISGYGKTIDFTKLSDTTELMGSPAVIEGTYNEAYVTFNYTAGANELPAQIYVDLNGVSTAATIVDSTGATAGALTYYIHFDPNHPLVITRYQSSRLNFHFDMSAATIVNGATSPPTAAVRPFLTASTAPVDNKPVRARGGYVDADTANSNFTINAVSFFDTASTAYQSQGAELIQTDANTTYNVNGLVYRGAAGLTAISQLSINTNIAAFGALDPTSYSGVKPTIKATQVYAGIAVENLAADRVSGTVASVSPTTLHIHNAEVVSRVSSTYYSVIVSFYNDLAVNIASDTPVTVDGNPEYAATTTDISVGQVVDIEGLASFAADGITVTGVDAAPGSDHLSLIRLSNTTAWGTLNAAVSGGTAGINLFTLGGVEPSELTFTGTGSASGADADPTNYIINTAALDTSTTTTTQLTRFDGNVTAFGAAPPDFTANAVTPASAVDQILTIDWPGGQTTAPFVGTPNGSMVINLSSTGLGNEHFVQVGPMTVFGPNSYVDLTNPLTNVTIVGDPSIAGQFTIGNPTDSASLMSFNDFTSFLTQVNTTLNGTNALLKLVAVGKYDPTTATFTAYRIDMVPNP